MKRLTHALSLVALATLLISCGGGDKTYSPSTSSTGDWVFVLGQQAASKGVKPLATTDLGTLENLGTVSPGQSFSDIVIDAVAQGGFTGSVQISDAGGTGPDHIAAVPSVTSIQPTPTPGASFTVGFSVPNNYAYSGSGVTIQGKDASGRIKTAKIAFNVATVSGSFQGQTFAPTANSGSGPLVLTPLNGLTGPVNVALDTNILPTDGVRAGDLPLPSTVQATGPSAPVTLGSSAVSTPINFTWTSWPVGNYALIAVLTKTGTSISIRVPLEITITAQGDWQFVLGSRPSLARPAGATAIPILTNIGNVKPGQTVIPVGVLAQALNGFTGTVTLADVPSTSVQHIAAVPSVASIVPTAVGAPFTVGITIPANYPYSGTGVVFQGTDNLGRVKQEQITFSVVTVSGAFAPATFASSDLTDTSPLTITPINGFTGAIAITFDTNLAGAPTGFQPLPSTVQVAATGSPVAISSTAAVSTPIKFTWTTWPAGNYEVIAVLTNGTMAIRVPVQITVTASNTVAGGVLTWHNDGQRTGQYPYETILTPTNVVTPTFGKLFTHATTASNETQPLYMPQVAVAGKGTHNVVYLASGNDMVYAYDADNITGTNAQPLWTANLGTPIPSNLLSAGNETWDGILSTPVIDGASGTMYVLAMDSTGGVNVPKLHALDVTSGTEKLGGPVTVTGSVVGTAGTITMKPLNAYQRPALLLLNGVVYVAFGGQYGDPSPDRGWLFGYNANTLQQLYTFTTASDLADTAGLIGGSIWMGTGGPSTDGTNVFVTTGNGDFNGNNGGHDFADTILKLAPSGSTMAVQDYFTPFDQKADENEDLDLGSACPLLIPSGSGVSNLIQIFKGQKLYNVNPANMGKFNANADQVIQEFPENSSPTEALAGPAYYNNNVFLARQGGPLVQYGLLGTTLTTSPKATSSTRYSYASPSISFNGIVAKVRPTTVVRRLAGANTQNAIVWIIENANGTAVLHAYDALSLSELYNSAMSASDTAGPFIKWGAPTIAGGKVYVPCANGLTVYGLLPQG